MIFFLLNRTLIKLKMILAVKGLNVCQWIPMIFFPCAVSVRIKPTDICCRHCDFERLRHIPIFVFIGRTTQALCLQAYMSETVLVQPGGARDAVHLKCFVESRGAKSLGSDELETALTLVSLFYNYSKSFIKVLR